MQDVNNIKKIIINPKKLPQTIDIRIVIDKDIQTSNEDGKIQDNINLIIQQSY